MKRGLLFIPLGLFIVLGAFLWKGLSIDPTELPSALLGKAFPCFKVETLKNANKIATNADLIGQPVLINVWATWCPSCRQEHVQLLKIAQENIRYIEVRFSPGNYTRSGLLDVNGAVQVLLDEARDFMRNHSGFIVNFLIMATRHKSRMAMAAHVAAAVTHFVSSMDFDDMKPGIVGFDLAGQEEGYDPVKFQEDFLPLHRSFVNITIHAGEMADDDRIWQALYLLHAKRIGHGLKLINNTKMMDFVRDHALCVEMCPSSNWQTNSFRCFDMEDKASDIYPLADYLAHGITVTVNTDNRFISDTTMSDELLMAARMTKGGISLYDIIKIIRNSFQAAFLPKDVKDALLKRIDDEVFEILKNHYFA